MQRWRGSSMHPRESMIIRSRRVRDGKTPGFGIILQQIPLALPRSNFSFRAWLFPKRRTKF
jgi:hypothetical protein